MPNHRRTGEADLIPAMPKSWNYELLRRIQGADGLADVVLFCCEISAYRDQSPFAVSDAGEVAVQCILKLCAATLRPRHWSGVCSALSWPRNAAHSGRDFHDFRERVEQVCGSINSKTAKTIYSKYHAILTARKLSVFRETRQPDPVTFEFHGTESLDRSLSRGKGVLLWSTDMMFRSLVEKRGLWEAGYRPSQISHRVHGFSYSEFGIRHLNPRVVAAENQYLCERIVFSWDTARQAVDRALELLKKGKIVIFTNNITAGRNFFEVPLQSGGYMTLSGGPPGLSQKFGIPIHTISTIETEPFARYAIYVSDDISDGNDAEDPITARANIACRARDEVTAAIRRAPAQYLPWNMIAASSRFTDDV